MTLNYIRALIDNQFRLWAVIAAGVLCVSRAGHSSHQTDTIGCHACNQHLLALLSYSSTMQIYQPDYNKRYPDNLRVSDRSF